jgi:hypothetical protein
MWLERSWAVFELTCSNDGKVYGCGVVDMGLVFGFGVRAVSICFWIALLARFSRVEHNL